MKNKQPVYIIAGLAITIMVLFLDSLATEIQTNTVELKILIAEVEAIKESNKRFGEK